MKAPLRIFFRALQNIFKHHNYTVKFLFLLVFFGLSNFLSAATISSTAAGGDWSSGTTWVGGVVPTATDDVFIVAGSMVVVRSPYVSSAPAMCNSITIEGTLTIGSGSTTPHQLNVQTFIMINSVGTLNQGGNAYNEIYLSGDFTNNGTFTPTGNSGSLNITFNGITGQTINGSSGSLNFGDIIINKTSGQLSVNAGITSVTAVTVNQMLGSFLSPATLLATGDIKLTGGTFTAGSNTYVSGNFTNDGASFVAGSGTVIFSGASQLVGGSTPVTFNQLVVNNGSNTTISTAPTINGDLIVNDGAFLTITPNITVNGKTIVGNGSSGSITFYTNASPKIFNGLITINNGATWDSSIQSNENFHLSGGLANFGTMTPGNGIYFFETNAQDVSGSVNVYTADVAIALTNKGTFTITSSLQGSGSLTQSANSILDIGASNTIATLTASAPGNTVNYYGVAQSVTGINYVNLGLLGDGTKTLSTNTTSISGNLTLNGTVSTTTVIPIVIGGDLNIGDGATFTAAGVDITVIGSTNIGNGSSGQLIISSTAGTKTFAGLVTVASGATWDNTVGENPHFQNGILNNGTFTSGSGINFFEVNNQSIGGTISMENVSTAAGITVTNNGTITTSTDLTVNGSWTQGLNSVLNINGTSAIAAMDASSLANTINYTGADQTVKSFVYYNLGLSGSGTKTLLSGINSILGNLALSGTLTSATSNTLAIGGDLFVGDGTTFNVNGFNFSVGGKTMVGSGASGTLNFTSLVGVKTFSGLITISAGATWNNSTNNSAITCRGGLSATGTFQSGTGVYTFDTNAQSLTGSFSIPNVVVNGVALTNNNSLTIATSLSGTGSITQGSGATLIINGKSALSSIDASASGNSVTYNATSPAIIAGIYNDLILNQASGTAALSGNVSVNGTLTLSAGNLDIGTSTLTLGNAAAISVSSPSAAKMIIASGGGEVRKTFGSTGSFTFPVGDNIATADYSPVTVNVTSGSGSGYIGVSVVNSKNSSNASSTDYLNRYWNIMQSGITGCVATITGTYVAADISGTEANIKAAQLDGTFDQVSNGWKPFSVLASNLLTATGATLTNGQTSVFTGISGASPTVSITGGGVTVCSGTSVSLGATVSGSGTIAYSWSPSTGLSATNVVNPSASVSGNKAWNYTLTIYDANGISASSNTTITSQQPTIAVSDVTICAGSSKDLTASGASTYSWSPATGLSSASGATVTASPAATTSYVVTGTDANNCTNTANVTVTVTPLPAKPTITGSALNTANPLLTSSSSTGNQWFKGGTAISGATNNTYKPIADGSYTVQVTSGNCSSLPSDPFNFILTAVESISNSGRVVLYPIPVDKQLNIEWNGFLPETAVEVRIYDLLGRTVLTQTMMINQSSIELNHLSSGQFIFQAVQGNLSSTQRFMKK